MIVSIVAGLIVMLKADSDVTDLVSTRVYGFELADGITMPQGAIVVEASGGSRSVDSYAEIAFPRVDIRCYGETIFEAEKVWRTAHKALKQIKREVHGSVLIHAVNSAGGHILSRADDTDWPRVIASYQVMHSEVAIA